MQNAQGLHFCCQTKFLYIFYVNYLEYSDHDDATNNEIDIKKIITENQKSSEVDNKSAVPIKKENSKAIIALSCIVISPLLIHLHVIKRFINSIP